MKAQVLPVGTFKKALVGAFSGHYETSRGFADSSNVNPWFGDRFDDNLQLTACLLSMSRLSILTPHHQTLLMWDVEVCRDPQKM